MSPVNPQVLDRLLEGYDVSIRNYLVTGFREGFVIDYEGPLLRPSLKNHPSFIKNIEIGRDKILQEVMKGRVLGPFKTPPFNNFVTSPLGLVPKKEPGEYRMIHDLSYPRSNSVNAYIPRSASAVQYETLDQAIQLVVEAGKNALIAKTDIENAYRIVPVHPSSIHLLGMSCNGVYYFDAFLPFGLSQSCAIFETFSTALQWCLKRMSPLTRITHILDDFIFIGPEKTNLAQAGLSSFLTLSKELGVPVKHSKTVVPTTCAILHGIEVDTIASEARLPQEKLSKATQLLSDMQKRKKVTLKQLQELLGFLNFICKVVVPGRVFLRRLTDLTKGLQSPNHFIRLTKAARSDLSTWLSFLQAHNGISILRPLRWVTSTNLQLYSDSAGSCGFAAVLGSHWISGPFPDDWKSFHISILELYPILLAIFTWAPLLANKCIIFHCDNLNVVYAINSQTSKQPTLMILLRKLVLACLNFNILFTAKHIKGKHNVIPDFISRFQMQHARQLAPWLDLHPTPIPEELQPQNILSSDY